MYTNPQTEIMQLLTFMKQEAIRNRIGNDLLKFVADNPEAMNNIDILGAVMSDPAKVLSAQAKKLNDGESSGIDIEKMKSNGNFHLHCNCFSFSVVNIRQSRD